MANVPVEPVGAQFEDVALHIVDHDGREKPRVSGAYHYDNGHDFAPETGSE